VHVLLWPFASNHFCACKKGSPQAQNHGLLVLVLEAMYHHYMQHHCKLHELLAQGCCTGCMLQRFTGYSLLP